MSETSVVNLSSNEPELSYSASHDLSYRKKHGQFFTPYSVACFMSQWIAGVSGTRLRILDPCAGLGIFERALCSTDPTFAAQARFTLWEKDQELAEELSLLCGRLTIRHAVTSNDFLNEHDWSATYDGIIANPPYYKHHYIENKQDILDAISSKVGADFSLQTNIYCWFLIKALALLKPGGRLAFIIPTEFLNANYGRKVKKHLLDTGALRHIISVCYKNKTFDDAISTACVLLAEKVESPPERFRFYHADSHEELGDLWSFLDQAEYAEHKVSDVRVEHKWRSYFPGRTRAASENARLVPLSTYGRFSRGIATGANEFFAIRPSTAEKHDLPQECLIPCVSKARQARQKTFTQEQFAELARADEPVLLFDGNASKDDAVKDYIRLGENAGYQHRYLTRTRSPWYALERRAPGRIWAGVFGRTGMRFIWNESSCLSLTCFHVFQPKYGQRSCVPYLFLYMHSSIGREFLEYEKREYGDGLEKYEPNDINRILTPDFAPLDDATSQRLTELHLKFIKADKRSPKEKTILDDVDAIFRTLI